MENNDFYKCNICKDKGWLWDLTDKFYKREKVTDSNGNTTIKEDGTAVVLCECQRKNRKDDKKWQ